MTTSRRTRTGGARGGRSLSTVGVRATRTGTVGVQQANAVGLPPRAATCFVEAHANLTHALHTLLTQRARGRAEAYRHMAGAIARCEEIAAWLRGQIR